MPVKEMTTVDLAGLEAADGAHDEALGLGLEVPVHVAAVDADLEDVELDGVEHELVDGLDDVDGDLDAPVERRRGEVGASSTS